MIQTKHTTITDELAARRRFHVEGQTSTLGRRWQIWDKEQHRARFKEIADELEAHRICEELNALTRPKDTPTEQLTEKQQAVRELAAPAIEAFASALDRKPTEQGEVARERAAQAIFEHWEFGRW